MKLLALSILCGLLCGCGGSKKSASDQSRDTVALAKLFPSLETDRVTGFRYQDWCQVLGYKRGNLAQWTEGDKPPRPAKRDAAGFDVVSKSDLERVWKEVRSTGTGVFFIEEIEFDATGRVKHGVFHCDAGQKYIFDPGYTLPADMPNEIWHTRIDSDWYYVLEDWN
jgi:hypothetical protein